MESAAAKVTSLVVAVVAAVWWSIAITLIQPQTEPAKPWGDQVANNNDYWVRDVRFTMIAIVVVAFVWANRGDLRLTAYAIPSGLAWIGVDVLLDRVDFAGVLAAVATSVVAAGLVVALWFVVRHRTAEANRSVLIVAASVAACLAALIARIESPLDDELGLPWSGAIAGVLGTVAALGCITTAGSRYRRVVSTVVVGVLSVAAVVLIRLLAPDSSALNVAILLAVVLLATVAVRGRDTSGAGAWMLALLGCLVGFIPVLYCVLMTSRVSKFFASWLTSLAGNPPVNGADTDVLVSMLAVILGFVMGLVLAGISAARPDPGHPVPRPVADAERD